MDIIRERYGEKANKVVKNLLEKAEAIAKSPEYGNIKIENCVAVSCGPDSIEGKI